jgi:uncharacterized repeat protein (TIGR01451 family)
LPADLEPGESITCSAEHAVTQADLDRGQITNVATATGVSPGGQTETGVSGSVVTPVDQRLELSLAKTGLDEQFSAVGETLSYEIVTTNTGNVTVSDVTVEDPIASFDSCTPAMPATLAPGAEMRCVATHVVTEADMAAGKVDNTATASGKGPATCENGGEDLTCPTPIVESVNVLSNTVTVNRATPPTTAPTTAVPTTATPTTAPSTTATPTTAPPTTAGPTTAPPTTAPPSDQPILALTGGSVALLLVVALSMLVSGFVLLVWRRRHRLHH